MTQYYYILVTASFVLGTIAYFFEDKTVLIVVLLALWIALLSYSLVKFDKRIGFCAFIFTIFAFLLSRLFINALLPNFHSDYTIDVASRSTYSTGATYFVLYSLILSLVGLCVGYLPFTKKRAFTTNVIENPDYLKRIRIITKRLTFLFFLFSLLVTMEKIQYIWAYGYVDFYLNYKEGLPHICYTLAASYKFSFFLYLATFPSKKEAKLLIFLYLLNACVSLLTGQRGSFMTPLLFIIIYAFIRNSMSPDNPWIGKKGKLAILITIPFLCASMFIVMLIRGNDETSEFDIMTLFLNFFYQLGGSEAIIGFSYDLKSVMPEDQWYSIGPLLRFFNDTISIFGISDPIEFQTIEMATRGHDLGSFLTYQIDPNRYFAGGNIASSYVAELWIDFGFIGIFMGNFIYGRILAALSSISKPNIWKTTLILIMVNRIMTAPRASFTLFITDCLSFSFIVMILYILGRCKGIPHYISIK